ncbi:hypothetical protein [Aeromonas veronii]
MSMREYNEFRQMSLIDFTLLPEARKELFLTHCPPWLAASLRGVRVL